MGSQSAMKLPVLDFSGDLKHGDERWNALTREVQGALEGPGCFEAVYNTAVLESLQKEIETVKTVAKNITEFAKLIKLMVMESYGAEKYFDDLDKSTNYHLRMMNLNGHTDKNMMTKLCPDQVGGLEVQFKDGSWVPVVTSEGSLVVAIGESFMAWSNRRLHPVRHRVMLRGYEDRYSCGIFSIPARNVLIKTPKELVDEDHPLLFKPFDYHDYYKFYKINNEYGLKEFAGNWHYMELKPLSLSIMICLAAFL
ncbi:probable 2-oxoglutarate-dependent dioxygenase AOP1 [Amborella trichopoda]|uniref:probable 2-oxoglutarate-dependent dioxygenase AOP1 n=1 Tax=Amborella trichopoda TaxID=13333 RepID=UPI0009BD599E|nr:probable 2-oxoglutarate-dependent dioxygenase AOP1 [Amborella trichopoda]|eukprot:XP_011626484.2 probable 2-oxoglutarate-dependent dioxygenase AOP1 [Amborella trichopoda]